METGYSIRASDGSGSATSPGAGCRITSEPGCFLQISDGSGSPEGLRDSVAGSRRASTGCALAIKSVGWPGARTIVTARQRTSNTASLPGPGLLCGIEPGQIRLSRGKNYKALPH